MKPTQYSSLTATFFWVAIFFIIHHSSSTDSPSPVDTPGIGTCALNFSYAYKPSGECIGSQRKISQWGSLRSTICCRNVLTALSQALALRARDPQTGTSIFMPLDPWSNCTGPFYRQPSVSAGECGFGGFFYGAASSGGCANLTLQDIKQENSYKDAIKACSPLFDDGDDFSGICTKCSAAVMNLRDQLMSKPGSADDGHDKKTQKAMCGVGAVTSLAEANLDNRSRTEDFYRCLIMLDEDDPDYLKIKYSLAQVLLAIIVAMTTIGLIIALVKYVSKRKKTLKREKSKEHYTSWSGLYRFSKAEIDNAINYGNEKRYLGRGSAGQVYRGTLPSGQAVAIKHINNNNDSASFQREVANLSRIRHPNLVCLFGFCVDGGCHYLVYEYCPGGNLAQQLLKKDTQLTWDIRVKILRDCSLALRYLHRFIDGCIVHRDIKLTNILLTENLEAKLSDFGLAKMMNMEESKVFTKVRGTIGYMDPEYMSNAKLTCASDVYSFGIVALQILSGQKVIELNLDASEQLTRKARDANLGNRPLEDFEDPRLKGKVNKVDFRSILQIAVLCVAKSSLDRPTIDMVFNEMDKAYKNTELYKKEKLELSSSLATPASPSLEVITV